MFRTHDVVIALLVIGALDLLAIAAARALRSAGRAPPLYVGFVAVTAMAATGFGLSGLWMSWNLPSYLADPERTDRIAELAGVISELSSRLIINLAIPLGLLVITTVLAIVRRPPAVPPATVRAA